MVSAMTIGHPRQAKGRCRVDGRCFGLRCMGQPHDSDGHGRRIATAGSVSQPQFPCQNDGWVSDPRTCFSITSRCGEFLPYPSEKIEIAVELTRMRDYSAHVRAAEFVKEKTAQFARKSPEE